MKLTNILLKSDDFWYEVKLRAENNYGNWTNKGQARVYVQEAIEDVLSDFGFTLKNEAPVSEIVEEMMEDR